jgi:Ca2+-binding EF-hand superfamily protein
MKKFLYAAGFSLVLSGTAFAHPAMPNPDSNGDGKVSLAEFQQSHADQMMKLDTNKDGKITEAEFMARPGMKGHDGPPPTKAEGQKDKDRPMRHERMEKKRGERQGMMFDMLDANDDGALAKAEIERMTAKRFKRMDKNSDNVLSGDELPKPPMKGGRRGHHGSH